MSGRSLVEIYERKISESKAEPALKDPKRYMVFLVNDDYTPMDFVVEVIKKFFNMSQEAATEVMFQVHYNGKGSCGIYTRDVAETKVSQVNNYARTNEHPLLCRMEPVINRG